MIRFESGDLRLTILSAGTLWLDGGAMFGVVPKTLWAKLRPPDERNRIRLGMNVLLVEDGTKRTLIDNGAGTKWDAKQRDIYGFAAKSPAEILEPAGLTPGDIDVVLDSHLHFDHAGGNTELDADLRLVPSFPNARYVVQKGELEFARSDNERIRASYLPFSLGHVVDTDVDGVVTPIVQSWETRYVDVLINWVYYAFTQQPLTGFPKVDPRRFKFLEERLSCIFFLIESDANDLEAFVFVLVVYRKHVRMLLLASLCNRRPKVDQDILATQRLYVKVFAKES